MVKQKLIVLISHLWASERALKRQIFLLSAEVDLMGISFNFSVRKTSRYLRF